MLSALELFINGYIKPDDGAALEKMKAHRQRLAVWATTAPLIGARLLDTLNGEVTLIDAELEKMRTLNPDRQLRRHCLSLKFQEGWEAASHMVPHV
jgi:hypothetical protein